MGIRERVFQQNQIRPRGSARAAWRVQASLLLARREPQRYRPTMFSKSSCRPERGFGSIFSLATRLAIASSVAPGLQHRLRRRLVPARVALGAELVELAVLDHRRRRDQRLRAGVDAADMAEQEVARVDRLAAHLGVEVEAAGRDPAGLEDEIERRHEFGARCWGTGRCPSRTGSRCGWRRPSRGARARPRARPRARTNDAPAPRGRLRC